MRHGRLPLHLMAGSLSLFVLIGGTAPVFGQGAGGGGGGVGGGQAAGGETRGVMRLQGHVVCVGCSTEEVRTAHPELSKQNLYIFTHDNQQLAFRLDRVNNAERWDAVTLTDRMQIRGQEQVWQTLLDEASRKHDVILTGILRSTGTFDVTGVSLATAPAPAVGNGIRQE